MARSEIDSTQASAEDVEFDVFLAGPVFMDIIFSGMEHAPVLGTETWASSMGSCPGGIANMAVAMSRLGLSTSLATAFGDDAYGDFCRESLELSEGIDISRSVRMTGRHTPLTISLAYDGDRTMVSHGHVNEHPSATLKIPTSRSAFASVVPDTSVPWLEAAHRSGSLVVVNSGWDATGKWDLESLPDLPCADVFVANEVEARSWTRAPDVVSAARALAERVALAVVTRGAHGVVAVDRATATVIDVPGLPISALDPTGAGDVFLAGLTAGLTFGRSARESLCLGTAAAALSVRQLGGSFAAPMREEILAWYHQNPARASEWFESDYAFIPDLFPRVPHPRRPRRAVPTVGFRP